MMGTILSEIVTESLSWKANGVPAIHRINQFKQLFADGLIWRIRKYKSIGFSKNK